MRVAAWILVALAIPRLVRLLYPYVWVEDDIYLESTYAMSAGLRPYLDFTHPQMPLLELFGSWYVAVAGASHLSMELLNGAAIYATSLLTLVLGRRAVGPRVGIAAALLLSCSSLVFRYHVWAREFFVSAAVLSAALLLIDAGGARLRRVLAAAALLAAACAIKLTAAVSVAAIVVFLVAIPRRPRTAAIVASATAAGVVTVAALSYWRYGFAFVFQAVLFHFMKGTDTAGAGPAYAGQVLDLLGPLSVLGLIQIIRRSRPPSEPLWFVLIALASLAIFYTLISPTAWGHNYLELLPFLAIVAGTGAVWLVQAARTTRLAFAAGLAVVAVFLIWVTPLVNESFERGSVYGFGFVPRSELRALADALRAATRRDDEVIAPAYIAFEANRLQHVRFPENYGVMRAAEEEYRTAGFAAARARFGRRDFFDLINQTSGYWNNQVIEGLAVGGKVNAFIPDETIQLLPLVNATPDALVQRGFQPALQTPHYVLWTRPGARP